MWLWSRHAPRRYIRADRVTPSGKDPSMSLKCCSKQYPTLYKKKRPNKCSFLCWNRSLTPLGKQYWFFFKKAIAWRFLATLITFFVAAVVTGDFTKASHIGGIELAIKIIVYMLHERFWESTHKKVFMNAVHPQEKTTAQPPTPTPPTPSYTTLQFL